MVVTAAYFGVVPTADNDVCDLRKSLQLTLRDPGGDRDGVRGPVVGGGAGDRRRGEADRARRRGGPVGDPVRGGGGHVGC